MHTDSKLIITIDGPSAAGKTTTADMLATSLHMKHVDAGSYYRALAWKLTRLSARFTEVSEYAQLLNDMDIQCPHPAEVWINGVNVSDQIRRPEITALASELFREDDGAHEAVSNKTRQVVGKRAIVVGRDAGSFIFPDANLKVWLTAAADVRGLRAGKRWGNDEADVNILRDSREASNTKRKSIPLPDSVVIDTTSIPPKEVTNIILKRLGQSS